MISEKKGKKKKVFAEIQRLFLAEIENLSGFSGQKQVISKKKGLHSKYVVKSGVGLQKLRNYRWQTPIGASICTPVAASLLISSGHSPRLGGHNFRLGRHKQSFGGHGPEMPPVAPGLPSRQAKITRFVKNACQAYFGLKLGDQDKAFAPHMCCKTCVEALRFWSKKKIKSLPFGIPMVLREGKVHVTDCYFCMTNLQLCKVC